MRHVSSPQTYKLKSWMIKPSHYSHRQAIGLPEFLDNRHVILISVRGRVDPRGCSAVGRTKSMTDINLLMGNRTRELLHCSTVPQLTAPAMRNLPDRLYISREADTSQLEDFNILLHRCQKLNFARYQSSAWREHQHQSFVTQTWMPVFCLTWTYQFTRSRHHECRCPLYTYRNKYHHLWYRNVIIQTSLSSERKTNERKQARSELTSCDVNSAVPFSATLKTAQNERTAASNMLIVCTIDLYSACYRYITTKRYLKGQSVTQLTVFWKKCHSNRKNLLLYLPHVRTDSTYRQHCI